MTRIHPWAVSLLALSSLCALPALAVAGPSGVTRLDILNTGKARLVVATAPAGMVIFDERLEVYRIYRYQALTKKGSLPEQIRIGDLDGDGHPEIIGIGKPTFGLDPTGNPLWDFPDGCSELATGDLQGTPEKEIACIHGRALTTLAVDGSVNWEVQLSSANMTGLAAGMLGTTDGKEGLEFNVNKEILRFAGNGTPLPGEATERQTQPVDFVGAYAAGLAELMSGRQEVDLDGDGTAADKLLVQGNKLTITVAGAPQPVEYVCPTGAILSLGVAEGLGPEGKSLIVVGGERLVAFVGLDGLPQKEVTVDFARATRQAKVELVGANGVGFEQRELAEKPVIGILPELQACYERRHKAYSLTRLGKTMFRFDIAPSGKVASHEVLYTTLNDAEVNRCIVKAVSRLSFPKPSEPNALVTADLLFGWTDSFR